MELKQVFRQADPDFIELLADIRRGVVPRKIHLLAARTFPGISQHFDQDGAAPIDMPLFASIQPEACEDGEAGEETKPASHILHDDNTPTLLYATRKEVARKNGQCLAALPGKLVRTSKNETITAC